MLERWHRRLRYRCGRCGKGERQRGNQRSKWVASNRRGTMGGWVSSWRGWLQLGWMASDLELASPFLLLFLLLLLLLLLSLSLSFFLSFFFFLRFCCFCILGLLSMNDCNYFWLINQVLETQFSVRRHVEKKKKKRPNQCDQIIETKSFKFDL